MEFTAGKPPKYKTQKELEEKIAEFFGECGIFPVLEVIINEQGEKQKVIMTDAKGKPKFIEIPPTNAGLAYYLGFETRQSLWDYAQKDKYSYTIKRALLVIQMYHERNLGTRDKPTGDIWWFKINGITEKTGEQESVDDKIVIEIDWGKDEAKSE